MSTGVRIGNADPSINVKWTTVFGKLSEVAYHGLLTYFGIADGGTSAVTAALGAFDSVSIDEPNESKAWALTALSLAVAIDDLRPEIVEKGQLKEIKKAFKAVRDKAKTAIETETFVMDSSFFSLPSSLTLYENMREAVIEGLTSLRLNQDIDELQLGAQLDAAFNQAVHEIMKGRLDYFRSLHDAIHAPGADAARLELDWKAYRSRLVHQFEVKPVFGQERTKISLSQLYVPLRAKWYEKKKGDTEDHDDKVEHLVDLHEELEKWVHQPPQNGLIKLICGGPGSGKSSFTKALAAKLAVRHDRRPVLIELQHLAFETKLEEEIQELLIDKFEYFRVDPLDKTHCDSKRPLVLIFDGLDELARPGGRGADEIARDFAARLERLLERLNGEKEIRAIAIVTGRNSIIQALQGKTDGLDTRDVLEVVGYAPTNIGESGIDASNIAKLDQRPEWWSKYANALGKNPETPEALKANQLQDITNEPLLCYLLAYSDYATENWEEAADNSNRVYKMLLTKVWERGWGGGPEGPVRALKDPKDFDLLLETMALATWHGDGGDNRVATVEGFRAALELTRAHDAWKRFQEDKGGDVTNLALTFYFRRADKDSRGFEFTHRSFSEYLVARLLFRNAMEIAEDVARGRLGHEALLAEWLKLAGPSHINEYMVPFLRNEARLYESADLKLVKEALEALISTTIRDGMPAQNVAASTWRECEVIQRNGTTNLLSCLNSAVRALFERDDSTTILQFDWGSDTTMPARFIRRLVDSRGMDEFRHLCLSHTDYAGELKGRSGRGSFMISIFLPGADLKLARFSGSNIVGGDFFRASLDGAALDSVTANNASFQSANLRAADLSNSDLENAKFRFADLSGANLSEANLRGVDLTAANLTGANLSGANLIDANLDRARFSGANLKNAKLPPNWRERVTIDGKNAPKGVPKPKARKTGAGSASKKTSKQ